MFANILALEYLNIKIYKFNPALPCQKKKKKKKDEKVILNLTLTVSKGF